MKKKKNAMARPLTYIAALFLLAACSNPLGIDALHQAASQGDVHAQMKLADRYFIGDGVPHDKAQSVFGFERRRPRATNMGFIASVRLMNSGMAWCPTFISRPRINVNRH